MINKYHIPVEAILNLQHPCTDCVQHWTEGHLEHRPSSASWNLLWYVGLQRNPLGWSHNCERSPLWSPEQNEKEGKKKKKKKKGVTYQGR